MVLEGCSVIPLPRVRVTVIINPLLVQVLSKYAVPSQYSHFRLAVTIEKSEGSVS